MIKATLTGNGKRGKIVAVGHAPRPPGAEKTGNLVCAAVSVLTSLTAEALSDIAGAKVETQTDDYETASGYLSFQWDGGGEEAETIVKEWLYGMRWLAASYPGTIDVTEQPAP